MTTPPRQDDLIVWPDGTECYRYELHEFSHKSDDYRVVPLDSDEWAARHEGPPLP